MRNIILILMTALLLAACGGETKPETEKTPEKNIEVPASMTLVIEGNDQMKFNKDRMTVYENQEITVILKHVGELDASAMGHNWTLLDAGVDVDAFAKEAVNYPDNEYLPPSSDSVVLARTRMLGGGESDTITFTAPSAGTYTYLCTFPGHYPMMKGSFVSKARP